MVPVQHQHVECRFAATISNRLEAYLLGPPCRLRRRGEVLLACLVDAGQTGHKDQARVVRFQQKRHKCPGHDVRASDVHVVGLGEAVAKRDIAPEEFDVEGGPWDLLFRV